MRLSVSATFDAIEARLALDPALAMAVVDLAEVVEWHDLDRDPSRRTNLVRLGHVLDALARHLAEDRVAVYPVAPRSLLSDPELTSNERMVVRRWADDHLVEVLEDPADRLPELASLLAVPVISRQDFADYADRYPWLPAGVLAPDRTGLVGRPAREPDGSGQWATARLWRCPDPACRAFGTPRADQRPPRLVGAAPTCPQHGVRLADAGARPAVRVLTVSVDGTVRSRFPVREAVPVAVGRSPEPTASQAPGAPPGHPPPADVTTVALAPWLTEGALREISRTHLHLGLRGDALVAVDGSTNGTTLHRAADTVTLPPGRPYEVGPDDVLELYDGVRLARPSRQLGSGAPSSIMAEAPTVSMRRP